MNPLQCERMGRKTSLTFHGKIMRQCRSINSSIGILAKYNFIRNQKMLISVENGGVLNCFTEDYSKEHEHNFQILKVADEDMSY